MHRSSGELLFNSLMTAYIYINKVFVWVVVIALLTRLEQQRFTIWKLAADWHELMIPWHIMRLSIAYDGEQLDPRCSTQTYHHPHWAFIP